MLSPSAEDFCENAIFVAQQNIKDIEKVVMFQYDKDAINNNKANVLTQDKLKSITIAEAQSLCR